MARITSSVNAIAMFPMTSYTNACRRHSAASRRKMPNVSPSHWTVSFSSISLLSPHILRSGFLYILFCTNRVTISYQNCIYSNSTLMPFECFKGKYRALQWRCTFARSSHTITLTGLSKQSCPDRAMCKSAMARLSPSWIIRIKRANTLTRKRAIYIMLTR